MIESPQRFDLVRRTAVIATGQGAVRAVEFVLALVLARVLLPQQWTELAFVLMVQQSAIGLGSLSLQDGLYFFYGRAPRERRRGVVLQTTLLLASAGLVTAVIVLFLRGYSREFGDAMPVALGWLALAVLLELPSTCGPPALIAAEKPGWASVFSTASGLLKMAALVIPFLLGGGVVEACRALAILAGARLAVLLVLVPAVLPGGSWALSAVREQLVYTAPLALSMATGLLNRQIDKWIVATFAPEGFGAYALAAQELPFLPLIGQAMGTILATRFTHAFQMGRTERTVDYWIAATSRVCLLIGPTTILVVLCAPEGVRLLLAPSYWVGIAPFQIYSLILLHRVMGYGMVLRAAGETRALWMTSAVLLAMNTVLSIPLTIAFGLSGAAAGTLVAYAINVVYFLHCMAQVMKTTLRRVFPWGYYGRVLAISTVAAGLALFAASWVDGDGLRLTVKAGVFLLTAVAGLGMLLSRTVLPVIPEEDPDFLESL